MISSASRKHLIHLDEHTNKFQAPDDYPPLMQLHAEVFAWTRPRVIGIEY